MSRSGYSEDCENLQLYRAAVDRALHGKRGQAFLRELIASLDALPEKALIRGELIDDQGACCAIGAVCKSRSLDASKIDYEEPSRVGAAFGIARSMAAEIAFMNDEWESIQEAPEARWKRMREWAASHIKASEADSVSTAPGASSPKKDLEEWGNGLARMVTEYVENGIRLGTDWRNGLAEIITLRLQRLVTATTPKFPTLSLVKALRRARTFCPMPALALFDSSITSILSGEQE